MSKILTTITAFAALFAFAAHNPAGAQSASPAQIQAMIAQGQEQTAISELQTTLQAHPNSGVAYYLLAEAEDASGNEDAARSDLDMAERFSPGLRFARPDDVAALRAHIDGAAASAPMSSGAATVERHSGVSPALLGIVGLVVLFLALRMLFRPRRFLAQPRYPGGYGPVPGPYPYGPGPGGVGPAGFGSGPGLGSSLLGGLAAGAGFAAGERVIDDVLGRNNDPMGGNFQQDQSFENPVPDRDDGLQGNPGWDDNSGNQDGNFDPGNNW